MISGEKALWPAQFPKSELLADVEAMVGAISDTLVSNLGEQLQGLWLKGSAAKAWDTPIDYVPELSDVDIHYRTLGEGDSPLADLDLVTSLHQDIERKFKTARPSPLHTPRPQLVPISNVEKLPNYVPLLRKTVRTLYGEEPPLELTMDAEAVRTADARQLLEAGDPQAVDKAVMDLLERPGRHLFTALRPLNWRLSPVAPRVLTLLGLDYATAWSSNRTNAVRLLREKGQADLAKHYAAYYEAGWEFFVSGWRNEEAGRSAFAAAVRALELGRELGRKFLHLHADYRTSQSV